MRDACIKATAVIYTITAARIELVVMLLGVDVVGVRRQRAPHHALVLVVGALAPALPRRRRSLPEINQKYVIDRPETSKQPHENEGRRLSRAYLVKRRGAAGRRRVGPAGAGHGGRRRRRQEEDRERRREHHHLLRRRRPRHGRRRAANSWNRRRGSRSCPPRASLPFLGAEARAVRVGSGAELKW